jgi:FKBP-type peptidyl-prolyl cis-trans isomerase
VTSITKKSKGKMKFSTTIFLLLLTLSLSAQKQTDKASGTAVSSGKLASAADTLQYSLGVFVGQWMINNGFLVSNKDVFGRGMDDIMQNKPRAIADSAVVPIIAAYQLSTQTERNRQMETQLFAALKNQSGVGMLPSGVHYIVIKPALGIRPNYNDTIVFHATGVFPDGTVFEDTKQKNQPITNLVSNLIPGLNEAIQLMPVGSVWRIFIPSVLAYGTAGLEGVIPGDMAVVFEIGLLEVRK